MLFLLHNGNLFSDMKKQTRIQGLSNLAEDERKKSEERGYEKQGDNKLNYENIWEHIGTFILAERHSNTL